MTEKSYLRLWSVAFVVAFFCLGCKTHCDEGISQSALVEGVHYLMDTAMVPCYDLEEEAVNIPAVSSVEVSSPEEALKIAWPEIVRWIGIREVFETIKEGGIPVINSRGDKFWMIYFPGRKGYFGGDMYIEVCKRTGDMRFVLGE